jgi:hypothetical protein
MSMAGIIMMNQKEREGERGCAENRKARGTDAGISD